MDQAMAQRAKARGERLRDELLTRLRSGPQTAVALLPQLEVPDVTLSEVAFQLERLNEEGRTVGAQGRWRLQ